VRSLILAGLMLIFGTSLAYADASVSGQWHADLGGNAFIEMVVLADGHWHSQTVHEDTVIATMSGTYEQTKQSETTGTLVFTPTESQTTTEHGPAQVEHDTYDLSDDKKVLKLTTGNDTMVFHKESIDE